MGLLSNIGKFFTSLGRLLGIGRATAGGAAAPAVAAPAVAAPAVAALAVAAPAIPALAAAAAAPAPAIAVPAVASFVQRAPLDRFLLACRLTSVGKLNVPLGRTPRIAAGRRESLPPVPAARRGAKRSRPDARGPRVLKTATPRPTADVIQFPARALGRPRPALRSAKAA